MIKVDDEVKSIIDDFVKNKQSFISLDVYCKLGIHFDDAENPIHEQVRQAYRSNMMPNYLCRWANITLEGGGYANCWKYYLPASNINRYKLRVRADGRSEISKKILGQFSLLECEMYCKVEKSKITYSLKDDKESVFAINASNRIVLTKTMLREASLGGNAFLLASVFPNRVEIVKFEADND